MRFKKICNVCGEYKNHHAKGMCQNCYLKSRSRPKKICVVCGEFKNHYAKGVCRECYYKTRPLKICVICGELKETQAYGKCKACYRKEYNKDPDRMRRNRERKRARRPLNKKSSNYLGCNIAEKVLSRVFKDVKVMPYGNPGYDFVCNKGKKIDVKSSCIGKNNNWVFNINENTTADFFLCIAFDSRESLTPLYLWLIPSCEVKDKKTTGISPNTLHKWKAFKLDIEETLSCCDSLKERA